MIQRIQSVLLLIAALVMISVLFLTIWMKADINQQEVVTLNAFELTYESFTEEGARTLIMAKDTFYISILAILASGIAIFSIFQYKNRLRQIQLGALNSLFMGSTLGLSYYFSSKGEALISNGQQGVFQAGFYIIAIALIMNSLANRFIRKDENLVRSANRIR
ncbi:MAG: DUF4293 domain-containing protein [Cyclobacteriaceae bacterium]